MKTQNQQSGVFEKFTTELKQALSGTEAETTTEPQEPPKLLEELTLSGVAKMVKDEKAKNIIVMTGAGVSTCKGPVCFGTILKSPTPCHYFIRLLHEKGLLLRTYTQNIDTLEHVAGIPADKVIEAHGSFYKSHCLGCRKEYSLDWMEERLFKDVVPRCESCEKVVKPDIVFFGEALPQRFFKGVVKDFPSCDLLIIMGTSLAVQPFASLIGRVGSEVPRLLINRDRVGQLDILERVLGLPGLDFDDKNGRDICWLGTCDDGCNEFAKLLGWEKDLNDIMQREWAKLDSVKQSKTKKDSAAHSKGIVLKLRDTFSHRLVDM